MFGAPEGTAEALGTHTEAQVGLSIPATKHQGALAGMHVPIVSVLRPAQWEVIEMIGARQSILTTRNNRQQER